MDESAGAKRRMRANDPAELPIPHRAQTSSPPPPPPPPPLPENIAPAAGPSWIADRSSPHREKPACEIHPISARIATPPLMESAQSKAHPSAHMILQWAAPF